MNVGILGGGLSGVALQHFLRHPSEVLERAPVPGGLCRTFWKDGFGFDLGGHILFSKYPHINQLIDRLLEGNLNSCRRANQVLFKGRSIKYPFENDLGSLERQDCYECLIDYLKNDHPAPTNLEEWAYYTFGRSIADKYLIPYNRKIWKMEPRDMGLEWVSRIPRPPMEDVVKSALGIATEGYTHQLHFRYPLHGGAEALVQALIKDPDRIRCGAAVQSIRREGKQWTVFDGRTTSRYDHLVIAFPIHEAIYCFADVPMQVLKAVQGLRYNALRVAFLAVNNTSLMDKSAVYIPDPSIHPHRVCFMGFFSPTMVRPGTSSLVAEITTPSGDTVDRMSDDDFLELIVRDLDQVGILRREDVILQSTRRVEYAYPVYDRNYTANVQIVRSYMASLGIDLLGRFAEFDYINADECLHRALRLAERLNTREQGLLAG